LEFVVAAMTKVAAVVNKKGIMLHEFTFDMLNETAGPFVVAMGRRRSGKTVFMRRFAVAMKFERGVGIVNSEGAYNVVKSFMPPHYIALNEETGLPDEKYLLDVMRKQKKVYRENDKDYLAIFIDDCANDEKFMRGKTIQDLGKNGRNYGCVVFATIQHPMDLHKARDMIDWLVLCRGYGKKMLQKTYEHYASNAFSDFDEFMDIYMGATSQYGQLVINLSKATNDISEKVFWYRHTGECNNYGQDPLLGIPKLRRIYNFAKKHPDVIPPANAFIGESYLKQAIREYIKEEKKKGKRKDIKGGIVSDKQLKKMDKGLQKIYKPVSRKTVRK